MSRRRRERGAATSARVQRKGQRGKLLTSDTLRMSCDSEGTTVRLGEVCELGIPKPELHHVNLDSGGHLAALYCISAILFATVSASFVRRAPGVQIRPVLDQHHFDQR